METVQQVDTGVVVAFDSDVWQTAPRARSIPVGRGGMTGAPVGPAPTAGSATTWLVDRLAQSADISARAPVSLQRMPGAPTRAALDRSAAPEIRVDLADGESAAILVEAEGVVGWQFPDSIDAPAPDVAGGVRSTPPRQARFRIVAPGGATATTSAQRGVFTDWLLGGVKATVLKFVARATAGAVIRRLERDKRTGPVVLDSPEDPNAWPKPADYSGLQLPTDRPPRILLFVHGTFSSTLGGFGELCATPWGRSLLQNASAHYDAVIAFDHRTLIIDPLDNARELEAALRTLPAVQPPVLDIVCHSRGGLVVRSLIETLLPAGDWHPEIGRVVFAAATNAGTELARPDNWHSLLDLVTNLSLAGQVVLTKLGAPQVALAAGEVVDCIGDFVRYLVDAAIEERRAPGLMAMNPDDEFVKSINREGDSKAADSRYYVVQSNFQAAIIGDDHQPKEFPRRLALMLANGFVDKLMKGIANDLVVDVPSMSSIDAIVGGYVKEIKDCGTNPLVYHTNYFIQPEVVDAIARWLGLPVSGAAAAAENALTNRRIIVVDATTPVAEVARAAAATAASHVVIRRPDPMIAGQILHYAPTTSEVAMAYKMHPNASESIAQALDLHEYQRSAAVQKGADSLIANGMRQIDNQGQPEFSRRTVVMHGAKPVAVLSSEIPDIDALAALAAAVGASAAAKAEPPAHRGGQRAVPPTMRGAPEAPQPPAPSPAVCHAAAEMPAEVEKGKTVTVTLTLSAEAIATTPGAAAAEGMFPPKPGKPILVQVVPKVGFVLADADPKSSEAEFDAPPDAGTPYVIDVNVTATDEGYGEVWAIVRQGPVRALTLTLRPTVVAEAAAVARRAVATSAALPPGEDFADVPTLEISQRRNGNETRFVFGVNIANLTRNRFESAPIVGDLEAYINNLYQDIENAWLGSKNNIAMFHDSLRATGALLFRQLVPPALRALLWKARTNDQLKSIFVLSDEPFVPWEIFFLDDPAQAGSEKACFFGELGLCRWLYGAVPVGHINVRPQHARYVIPHYPDARYRLAAAETVEEPMVKALLGAVRVEPHYAAVKKVLSDAGETDLLHFAGHGGAELRRVDDAGILLEGSMELVEGQRQYVTEPLLAKVVAVDAKLRDLHGRRTLVVLNACQVGRVGFSLTSIGGFAAAFLGTRQGETDALGNAGAFIGSLWSVGDEPASDFVRGFYETIKVPGGATVAQAVVAGRKAAKDAGDATWLAYTVYAHPTCRVILQ